MNSSPRATAAPTADQAGEPARGGVTYDRPKDQPIARVRDIRDDLQGRITALLRDLNI